MKFIAQQAHTICFVLYQLTFSSSDYWQLYFSNYEIWRQEFALAGSLSLASTVYLITVALVKRYRSTTDR